MSETNGRRIYGLAELAQRIGISRTTATVWSSRQKLPVPDERLACGPVWFAETVEKWLADR